MGNRCYYTYAYIRKNGTPYYVGKGKGGRIRVVAGRLIRPPRDPSRIIFLKRNLTEEEAFRHEIYMIFVFGRKDIGTGILLNRTSGGEGSSGRVLSQESLRKMSESSKRRVASEETRRKLSASLKGKLKGRRFSEETRAKMSAANKRRRASPETRAKMSKLFTGEKNPFYGKKHTLESRRSMSLNSMREKNPNFGKPKPPEVREKIAASNRGKKRSPETCQNISKAVKGRRHSPEVCARISLAVSNRVGEKNPNFGKRWWWNENLGKSGFFSECPGPGWVTGRGKSVNRDRGSKS